MLVVIDIVFLKMRANLQINNGYLEIGRIDNLETFYNYLKEVLIYPDTPKIN